MIFVFWMLSFKPTFSLSSFIFIKRLLNSSLLSAIRVLSSAYLRLLIFLPAILIPACASSSPAFLKQGDNIQPWCTPFPIWNQSVVPCPVVVSQEAGQVVWYSYLVQNFPQFIVIYTVKGFGIINKAEIDVFLELSCFFDAIITPIKKKKSVERRPRTKELSWLSWNIMSKAVGTYSALEILHLSTHSVLNYLTLSKINLTRNGLFGYKC